MIGRLVDFLQVLLSTKVLYEDCMTFLPECGADKSIVFQHRAGFFPPQVGS